MRFGRAVDRGLPFWTLFVHRFDVGAGIWESGFEESVSLRNERKSLDECLAGIASVPDPF